LEFRGGEGLGVFPTGSKNVPQVLNVFPTTFPVATHLFLPYSLAMVHLPL